MNRLPDDDFDSFFDDFTNPIEDDDTTSNDEEEDWVSKLNKLEPPPMDDFSDFEFTSCDINKLVSAGIQKTVPILKQKQKQKQNTSSEDLSCIKSTTLHQSLSLGDTKVSKKFQSLSPVSVLENSDGSFSPQNGRLAFPLKGVRSKRKRSTTPLRFRDIIPFGPDKSESLSDYYSCEQHAKKKRKIQSSGLEANKSDGLVRKCSHCETTKTPQWRAGPKGPKTLCNACGVRFRSGRLVPEYRPASSPTFIPSVHSNCHRKIIEMKRKDKN